MLNYMLKDSSLAISSIKTFINTLPLTYHKTNDGKKSLKLAKSEEQLITSLI